MQPIVAAMVLFSVLVPQKGWFAPDQPLNVASKAPTGAGPLTIYLSDFTGRTIEADANASLEVAGDSTIEVKKLFPSVMTPGTYLLYAVPKGKPNREFAGTPVVITVRDDKRQGAP